MQLKYLFQATFKDGSVYQQTREDVSKLDSSRSCFYDVLQSGKEVKTFFISDDKHTFSVNLEDGHFEVDGVPFFAHEEEHLKDFRLIYYIKNKVSIDTTYKISTNEVVKTEPTQHVRAWVIGWQCTINGKNYQRVIEV